MLTSGAVEALEAHASEEQKEKYLHQIIAGNWSATMNLTEPQAGSDVGAVKTKAEPQPDGTYKIYGTKIYITYGDHNMTENIIHLVFKRKELLMILVGYYTKRLLQSHLVKFEPVALCKHCN